MRRLVLLIALTAIAPGLAGCGELTKAPPPGAPDAPRLPGAPKAGV